jgi:hypothetical protein
VITTIPQESNSLPSGTAAVAQVLTALSPEGPIERAGAICFIKVHSGEHLDPESDVLGVVALDRGRHRPKMGRLVIVAG